MYILLSLSILFGLTNGIVSSLLILALDDFWGLGVVGNRSFFLDDFIETSLNAKLREPVLCDDVDLGRPGLDFRDFTHFGKGALDAFLSSIPLNFRDIFCLVSLDFAAFDDGDNDWMLNEKLSPFSV